MTARKAKAPKTYAKQVQQVRERIAEEEKERELQRRREQKYNLAVFECGDHPFSRKEFGPGELVPAQMFCPICGRLVRPAIKEPA